MLLQKRMDNENICGLTKPGVIESHAGLRKSLSWQIAKRVSFLQKADSIESITFRNRMESHRVGFPSNY